MAGWVEIFKKNRQSAIIETQTLQFLHFFSFFPKKNVTEF
jgi:hypothetical protein